MSTSSNSPKNACGPHTELVANNAVRVTRCGCGAIHLSLNGNGVTVKLSAEAFRNVAAGLGVAVERLGEPLAFSSTGTTSIN